MISNWYKLIVPSFLYTGYLTSAKSYVSITNRPLFGKVVPDNRSKVVLKIREMGTFEYKISKRVVHKALYHAVSMQIGPRNVGLGHAKVQMK